MAFSPVILALVVPYFTRAMLCGCIYMAAILLSAYSHDYVRFSTIGYLGMFLLTFIMLYNLVYVKQVFSLLYFVRFLRVMISAFAICLVLQQLFILIGIRNIPVINLANQYFLSINKLPSLAIEPSHTARLLGVMYYSYLYCCQIVEGQPLSLKRIFEPHHRWITIGFLYTMTTMGSGTAFIILGILPLYFINLRNAILVIPMLIGLVYLGDKMEIEQFDRAYRTAQATLTLDRNVVEETDGSASSRIYPMINTINNLDLTKREHLFGYGVDAGIANKSTRMIAEITDYGFIAYILGLILVFTCSIRFFSIPTIMFFMGVGGTTGNIAYGWGSLMVFMCVRYFHDKYE